MSRPFIAVLLATLLVIWVTLRWPHWEIPAVLYLLYMGYLSIRCWRPGGKNGSPPERFVTFLVLLSVLSLVETAAASPDLRSLVVGIGHGEEVVAAGVPYRSDWWGTDYITNAHILKTRVIYTITDDGKTFTEAKPVIHCHPILDGVDVLILRVAGHTNSSTIRPGNPAELRQGDKLLLLLRRGLYPGSVELTFQHPDFTQWSTLPEVNKAAEFEHGLVAEGLRKPGFSGSPWVREGKVYGLHKGSHRPNDPRAEPVLVAESISRIHTCLEKKGYFEYLIPRR